jgi:isoquinoline 1-oxidoreductase beta subunit
MRSGGDLDRRAFLVTASAAAGGLTLGFAIPLAEAARAVGAIPEITCWIAIAPDDSVTIRIARSEMGQGAMTGLAMLVAEELECDWSKVRTEFVSPTLNLAKNRIWGDTSTGASRSIARNVDRRRGGAMAGAAGAMRRRQRRDYPSPKRPHPVVCRDRSRRGDGRAAG